MAHPNLPVKPNCVIFLGLTLSLPDGLPAELGRKLNQHARKDLGGGFKILVDDNDKSRPKFQFAVPNASAA